MMQITEDTPPDMLAGAMDLTVHLPNGSAVKMSVERRTPMMDLLVQITTANHLQLSTHTLQALGMAPSSEHSDRILPFKPNTPIGALDTQHIRVLPKGRTLPAPKYTAPGHQPFESTFRLKVHLPRNQLYVTRVSRNVLLEDIMKKVCEEKNLDPVKYEFKHPGNLDQVLDPKLTLSDYQITEIYVVVKGTTNLSQAFSAADIMVLRKEEERKQMHTKTGGGVFNLIFKRGKSSMGSGSVSSENRSISPTHSDDSRSVTPPAVQASPIVAPPKKDPPPDRPKPPQRKRRPAPKPPQIQVVEVANENSAENSSSVVSNEDPSNNSSQKSSENGLTICHSRNSSDSSGYHEASILSDHCANTSLPRARPKSAFVGDQEPLQSTSNLSKMSEHSRSTTSLMAGRKKKAAPLPPPVPVSPASSVVAHSEKPSPLVASQSDISTHTESSEVLETNLTPIINPVPKPRSRTKAPQAPPRPRPSSEICTSIEEYSLSGGSSRISSNEDLLRKVENDIKLKLGIKEDESKAALNKIVVESVLKETLGEEVKNDSKETLTINQTENSTLEVELRRSIIKDIETPSIQSSASNDILQIVEPVTLQKLDHQVKSISQETPTINRINKDISLEVELRRPAVNETTTANITDSSTNNLYKTESVTKERLEDRVESISEERPSITGVESEVELRRPVLKENVVTNLKEKENISVIEFPKKEAKDNRYEFHLGPTHEQPNTKIDQDPSMILSSKSKPQNEDFSVEEMLTSLEVVNSFNQEREQDNGGIKSIEKSLKNEDSIISPPPVFTVQKSFIANVFTSEEFLKESKPPAIVGVIPKTPQEDKNIVSNKDSFGKRRGQFSKAFSMHMEDPETISISSQQSNENKSSRNSISSALDALDDEIADLEEDMFTGSLSKGSVNRKPEAFNQIFGMHEYDPANEKIFSRNISVGSLRSVSSLSVMNDGMMRKWDNTEELNSTSLNYYGVKSKWVAGDASDTESSVQTPRDSTPPFPLDSSSPVRTQSEEKSLESTDSGIAQDTPSQREKDEEFGFNTPPPPPVLDDIYPEALTSRIKESLTSSPNVVKEQITIDIRPSSTKSEQKSVVVLNKGGTTEKLSTKAEISEKSKVEPQVPRTSVSPPVSAPPPPPLLDLKKQEPSLPIGTSNSVETELADIDWHYQLPSPPKAFQDFNSENLILTETNSVIDFNDSVVTSPELFEKLKCLEDTQFEKDTIKSEVTSIASEEPLNMLSLEHLEKRKSLVYNRELATSLRVTDSVETNTKATDNFTSSNPSFQSTYDDINKTVPVQPIQPRKPARTTVSSSHHNTLPNFKISTYDVPKQNITVFEDDTISSNTHVTSTLTRNKLGRSMDNISLVKRLGEDPGITERDYKFYRPQTANYGPLSTVSRSESFSSDHKLPLKPVSRSKSTLTINKAPVNKMDETNISRSNSLFDVSGLQSLEVMKLIQNKLNTPTGSMENISYREKTHNTYVPQKLLPQEEVAEPELPIVLETQPVEEKPQPPSPPPVKKYYYRGPPAVNMTTWSERPKVPVSVKEDDDYKLGNANVSSKLIVNTTNNNITSNNSIEIRNNGFGKSSSHFNEPENRSVSVNVNGTDHISQQTNNVVIKIGGSHSTNNYQKNIENQRFLGPTAYRKPFSNININGSSVTSKQRPHSIALPSDFDISRVPVVRSVEFKKPFKDFHGSNTSVTHINQANDDYRSFHNNFDSSDSFADTFRSTENLKSVERLESESNKRVFRVGSFKPMENHSNPVIRGFRPERDVNHRLSWNPSSTYNTLPSKPKVEREYSTNQHVPFSQSTLKRTASSKIYTADQNYNDISKPVHKPDNSFIEDNSYSSLPLTIAPKINTVPPPPPQMPKLALKKVSSQVKSQASPVDPRDMLLDSIRNFGGKKGLRAVNV